MTATTAITPFNFNTHAVRVVIQDGLPWFIASDVCEVLGVKNHRDSLQHLDDDEKGVVSNDTLGGKQQVSVVNESGLYALVLRSRKPEAKKFTKWVTSEVLPSIRKTGSYSYTTQPTDKLNEAQQIALRTMLESNVKRLPKESQGKAMLQGWSKLKSHFKVPYREIPADQFTEALSIVTRHITEWEVLDALPHTETLNETVEHLVQQLEAGNGAPVDVFMPLFQAVKRKLEKQPTFDPTDAPTMKAVRDTALNWLNGYRAAVKEGSTFDREPVPHDVLHGIFANALMHQRMLAYFDYTTGQMNTQLVPSDASVVSLTKGDYHAIAQGIPMERIPEMLTALNKRVACHLGAFSDRLRKDRLDVAVA